MMTIDAAGWFALVGFFAVGITLILLARLSRRLGHVTQVRSYHRGFYVAAALVWVGFIARLVNLLTGVAGNTNLNQNILWIMLYNGIPAVGLTLGVVVAWYYWSWLLAERD